MFQSGVEPSLPLHSIIQRDRSPLQSPLYGDVIIILYRYYMDKIAYVVGFFKNYFYFLKLVVENQKYNTCLLDWKFYKGPYVLNWQWHACLSNNIGSPWNEQTSMVKTILGMLPWLVRDVSKNNIIASTVNKLKAGCYLTAGKRFFFFFNTSNLQKFWL